MLWSVMWVWGSYLLIYWSHWTQGQKNKNQCTTCLLFIRSTSKHSAGYLAVNVCCSVLGLSVLGLLLLVWREQSVPGDVVMTHRAVPPAPSQQQLSHAGNSRNRHTSTETCKDKCTYAHTDLCLHMYTLADKHTHTQTDKLPTQHDLGQNCLLELN